MKTIEEIKRTLLVKRIGLGNVYILSAKKTSCDYIWIEKDSKIKENGFTKMDLESIELKERFELYASNPLEIFKIF